MNILSIQAWGALYTLILFAVCAFTVHLLRLALFGYRAVKKKPDGKTDKSEAPEKSSEPVYYIVERKKKRPKTEYSDPKRISFK